MKNRIVYHAKKIAKIIIAIILVYVLVRSVNWTLVFDYIVHAKWQYIVLFIIFYVFGLCISALKWCKLAKHDHFTQSYSFYLKTYLTGTFVNNFLPSTLGGDAYRIYQLGKKNSRLRDSSATVFTDRASGLSVLIFLAAMLSLINYPLLSEYPAIQTLILIVFISFCFDVFFVTFFHHQFFQKIFNILPRVVRDYGDKISQFRDWSVMISAIVYSTAFSFIGIAFAHYMLFMALNIQLSLLDFMSVIFLTNVISSIPISVGNIGTKEWSYVLLFSVFGVANSALVAVVLLSRFLQMCVSCIALPYYMKNKIISTQN